MTGNPTPAVCCEIDENEKWSSGPLVVVVVGCEPLIVKSLPLPRKSFDSLANTFQVDEPGVQGASAVKTTTTDFPGFRRFTEFGPGLRK